MSKIFRKGQNPKKKYTEYKMTILKGSVGDLVTEWMTDDESKRFWEEHAKYVDELKARGEYLQPEEITIKLEEDPLYDNGHDVNVNLACESYRMDILYVGDNHSKEI